MIDVHDTEFSLIQEFLKPLTQKEPGAMSLGDDVAVLTKHNLVITKDVMIGGVHFRQKDPLDLVARKLMRVNISDLVAKGVRPEGYALGCVWPVKTTRKMFEDFALGLAQDQEQFRCMLVGGDTTRHRLNEAPLVLSATFYGIMPKDGVIRRRGARSGDDLYVTGTIGDAAIGLSILSGKEKLQKQYKDYLVDRYLLPQPRVTFGSALQSFATAALDVSDGILADAGHIAVQSDVAIDIDLTEIPLSDAARHWLEKKPDPQTSLGHLVSHGDDYEILFTAPAALRRSVAMAAKASKTQVSRIGRIRKGSGVSMLNTNGDKIELPKGGYDHFRD